MVGELTRQTREWRGQEQAYYTCSLEGFGTCSLRISSDQSPSLILSTKGGHTLVFPQQLVEDLLPLLQHFVQTGKLP